ncbi:hypothetical protein A5688_10595 [Mycobacterium mantenii]|nr:hypothetical protein A5688_10595 [Mycobacterium mantenii]
MRDKTAPAVARRSGWLERAPPTRTDANTGKHPSPRAVSWTEVGISLRGGTPVIVAYAVSADHKRR